MGAGRAPPGSRETRLLLAQAATCSQIEAIGNQTGGRVFLFLASNKFDQDYRDYMSRGVGFLETSGTESHGKVVVFRDPFGNKRDLIQPA